MTIVTKTGDEGTTGLYGGDRISKDSPRIHAVGTVDELNAFLGLIRSEEGLSPSLHAQLHHLQHTLFRVGGDLATPLGKHEKEERISEKHVHEIERWIQEIEASLPAQTRFLLPGGSKISSLLHLARTVCRRAERFVVALMKDEDVNPQVRIFLNRLSDYLFVVARRVNIDAGVSEVEVEY
jgi:cob(I)alamin adenosyltransferase